MKTSVIAIGVLTTTLLGIMGSVAANRIDKIFVDNPLMLAIIVTMLIIEAILYTVLQFQKVPKSSGEPSKSRKGSGSGREKDICAFGAHEHEKHVVKPSYSMEDADVIIGYAPEYMSSRASQSSLPPRIACRGGRLFGRADVFSSATEILTLDRPQPLIFHGLAGVGKSAIAAALAWGLAPFYKGGVIWLDKETHSVSALCDEIGRLYADESMYSFDKLRKLKRAHYLLNKLSTLVVIDNCQDHDVARTFAEQCAPQGLIITSRERMALVGKLMEVVPLTQESATNLFQSIAQVGDSQSNKVQSIISLFEGHPQAITIAAALLLEEHLPPSELLDLLKRADKRVRRLCLGKESKNSVWASFEASYDRLDVEEKKIFRILGGAWSRRVTRELIYYIAKLPNDRRIADLMRGILKHALISEEDSQGILTYRAHGLIYSYAQGLLHEEGQFDSVRKD